MSRQERYFGISPLLLYPGSAGTFRVYLRRGKDSYLLYCSENENFSAKKLQRLHQMGIEEVFIPQEDAEAYQTYTRDNLGSILEDDNISADARAKVFYQTSSVLAKEAFSSRLPQGLSRGFLDQINRLVHDCLKFLSRETNLNEVARLMSHDYETYTHCVNVFVLVMAMLRGWDGYSAEDLKQIGAGAVLHDIGKTQISRDILRKPGKLTEEEFSIVKRHPALGHTLCMNLELPPKITNIILYHHEKLDGSGYPTGIDGTGLPGYIRAVTIADIYDALTSKRAYAEAMPPFEALQLIQDQFVGQVDSELYAELIKILSGSVL